jgi:hypothetical protein
VGEAVKLMIAGVVPVPVFPVAPAVSVAPVVPLVPPAELVVPPTEPVVPPVVVVVPPVVTAVPPVELVVPPVELVAPLLLPPHPAAAAVTTNMDSTTSFTTAEHTQFDIGSPVARDRGS